VEKNSTNGCFRLFPPMPHTHLHVALTQKDKRAKARECPTKQSSFSYRETKRTNILQCCSEKSPNKQPQYPTI